MANQTEQLQISMTVYNSMGFFTFLQSISKLTNWCSLMVSQNGATAYCYGDLPYSSDEYQIETLTVKKCITAKLILDTSAVKLNHVPTEVGGKKIQSVHIFVKSVLKFMNSFRGIFQSQGYENGSVKIKFDYVAGYTDSRFPQVKFDHIWIKSLMYQKINQQKPEESTRIFIPAGKTMQEMVYNVFIDDSTDQYQKMYPLISNYVVKDIPKYPESKSLRQDLFFDLVKDKCQQFKQNVSNYVQLEEWPFIYLRSSLTPTSHVSGVNFLYYNSVSGTVTDINLIQTLSYKNFEKDISFKLTPISTLAGTFDDVPVSMISTHSSHSSNYGTTNYNYDGSDVQIHGSIFNVYNLLDINSDRNQLLSSFYNVEKRVLFIQSQSVKSIDGCISTPVMVDWYTQLISSLNKLPETISNLSSLLSGQLSAYYPQFVSSLIDLSGSPFINNQYIQELFKAEHSLIHSRLYINLTPQTKTQVLQQNPLLSEEEYSEEEELENAVIRTTIFDGKYPIETVVQIVQNMGELEPEQVAGALDPLLLM